MSVVARNDQRIGYAVDGHTGLGHYRAECAEHECHWRGRWWAGWDQAADELLDHMAHEHEA